MKLRFWRKREKGSASLTTSAMTVRCPVCEEAGRRSEVVQDYGDGVSGFGYGGSSFFDGRGELHTHGGIWGQFWRCSRGHRWMQTGTQSCDGCGRMESPETIVLPEDGVTWL